MLESRIRALFEIIDSRRWSQLREHFHPRIVYARPGYPAFEGIERVLHFYEFERVVASGTHALTTILSSAHDVACTGRFTGTHRNGSPIDEEFADFYRFDGQLIIRRKSYFFRPAI